MVRRKDRCCIITILVGFASLPPGNGKIFIKKEFQSKLRVLDPKISEDDLKVWSFIAFHESRYNTAVVGPENSDGSRDYGIFQLNNHVWCDAGEERKNGCGISCSKLTDNDIADDFVCAKEVYKETQNLNGNGFSAWAVYNKYSTSIEDEAKSSGRAVKSGVKLISKSTNYLRPLRVGSSNRMSMPALKEPLLKLSSIKKNTPKRPKSEFGPGKNSATRESNFNTTKGKRKANSKDFPTRIHSSKVNPKLRVGSSKKNTFNRPQSSFGSSDSGAASRRSDFRNSKGKNIIRPEGLGRPMRAQLSKSRVGSSNRNSRETPKSFFHPSKNRASRQTDSRTFKGKRILRPKDLKRPIHFPPPKVESISKAASSREEDFKNIHPFFRPQNSKSPKQDYRKFKGKRMSGPKDFKRPARIPSPKAEPMSEEDFKNVHPFFRPQRNSKSPQPDYKKFKGKRMSGPKDFKRPTRIPTSKAEPMSKDDFKNIHPFFRPQRNSSSQASNFRQFKGKQIIKPKDPRRPTRTNPTKKGPKPRTDSRKRDAFETPKTRFYPPKRNASRHSDFIKFKRRQRVSPKAPRRSMRAHSSNAKPRSRGDASRRNPLDRPQKSFSPKRSKAPVFRKSKGMRIINRRKDLRRP